MMRLGFNVDHVATVRNARGGGHPDPVRAAEMAANAGADSITAHLREDRRHIRDDDVRRLKNEIALPLNLEMAATEEMRRFARNVRPHACCLVPEKRDEKTTEGGLDVRCQVPELRAVVAELRAVDIRVSLFIDANESQICAAHEAGAPVVELHAGRYHEACLTTDPKNISREFEALRTGANFAKSLGLEVHAGHGLTFQNVQPIASIPQISELNIGHFIVGEALFMGLPAAIKEMKRLIQDARTGGHY
jgi:pyridoxine 5-phosphate synthase